MRFLFGSLKLIKVSLLPFLALLFIFAEYSHAKDLYIEKRNDEVKVFSIDTKNKEMTKLMKGDYKSPLGSLWKLFVYAYNKENINSSPPYTCNGILNEEIFCCRKGESIGEDEALAKSCGLFFSPYRLRISAKKWKDFWKQRNLELEWLINLHKLKPETNVSVDELLLALEIVKELPRAKDSLDKALVNVVLEGTAKGSLSDLGAFSRIKTFTWNKAGTKDGYVGGVGGWLSDGTVIWGMGDGRSSEYLERVSSTLDEYWKSTIKVKSKECVTIRYFHDYKIKSVFDLADNEEASEGALNGTYKINFYSGKDLIINSNEDLFLKRSHGQLVIDGRMNMNSYIARVLDREVNNKFESAAEAFSIVIRSYIKERSEMISGCYHVIDSSKFQRVSASIPTSNSVKISLKTSGLILNNASAIRYHLNKEGKNKISWVRAKELDLYGNNFEEILKSFYPNSQVTYYTNRYTSSCGIMDKAYKWLKKKSSRWHTALVRQAGYERPNHFKVCKLNSGAPFSNKETNEIFVRGFDSFENQYSIAHEYLHLAFKYHPIGNSEKEIDRLAKKLVTMF